MSRKDSNAAFNRLIGKSTESAEVKTAEITKKQPVKKEVVKKAAADPKPQEKKTKEILGKDYENFSTRMSKEAADYIREYRFAHKMDSIRDAIEAIILENKAANEKSK